MKMTFICSVCKKATNGWLMPLSEEEMKDETLLNYRDKNVSPPPIMIRFSDKPDIFATCYECHDKFAGIAISWLKNGLTMIEPEQKSEQ